MPSSLSETPAAARRMSRWRSVSLPVNAAFSNESSRRAGGFSNFQVQLAAVKLLIVDELGYVPLSQTGAELLFGTRLDYCHVKSSI
jgi:DNA replication protein DnaC